MEKEEIMVSKKRTKCERYSRIVGYLRPVSQWNKGKKQEYKDRVVFGTSKPNKTKKEEKKK